MTLSKLLKKGGLLLVLAVVLVACKKDEEPTPHELIVGHWQIDSQELLGTVVSGDGSYLVFNACESNVNCSGMDYRASDGSSGNITYSVNDEGTILTINDPSNDGGNYNYTWDVLELTDTRLRITTSTILGNLKLEMTKQ